MKWIGFLTFSISLLLTACGGDENPVNTGQIRPSGTVSGTAFDGLIINGNISVYDFSTGEKGDLLGSSITDGSGLYSIDIRTADKPIYLEVCGGKYVEEASGRSVLLRDDQCLFGLSNYVSGESVTMSLTYFSTMATGYAQCLIEEDNTAPEIALNSGNELASRLASYDITIVQPLDVSLTENATAFVSDEIIAGMYAAGISQMMVDVSNHHNLEPHEIYNSIYFSDLMYEDIKSDCLLDGIGNSGKALSMGSIPITGEHYRYYQSKGMLEFINSTNNATRLSASDLESNIMRFNSVDNSSTVVPPTEINLGTNINNFYPVDAAVVNGEISISAQLDDAVGILETRFLIDGEMIGTVSRNNNPTINLDTIQYGSGEFELSIEVTNDLFIKTGMKHNINISNAAPTVTDFSPGENELLSGAYTIRANVSSAIGIKAAKFLINGELLNGAADLNRPSQTFDTIRYPDGQYTISIVVTDNANQTTTVTRNVQISNSSLTLNIDSSPRRSIVYVDRLPDQIGSLEVIARIGDDNDVYTFSDFKEISFSGVPYAGIWLKCVEHSLSRRNTFAEITVNAVDSLGVSSSKTWTSESGNTCYGYKIES